MTDNSANNLRTDEMAWFARQFEEHRPRLRAVAHRMLGSSADADDALQEAWIRTTRSDHHAIDNIDGWLVTLVGRVCIDMLRARRARREDSVDWLPETVVSTGDATDPEQTSLVADSIGLALQVVLDTLEPAERLAFVLHDMFAVPYAEIGPILDRSPDAARQLASRARRRVQGPARVLDPAALPAQRRVVDAFLAAARAGDFEALLLTLDPEVTLRIDAGAKPGVGSTILRGHKDVAQHTSVQGPRFATLCQPAIVDGGVGLIAGSGEDLLAVVGLTFVEERIMAIDLVLDPAKLSSLTLERL